MEPPSFIDYFFEQDFESVFVVFAVHGVVYVGLILVVTTALRRPLSNALLFVVAATIALFVIALTIFDAAALYLRYSPHGTGAERADRDNFVFWAKASFLGLYAGTLIASVAVGYVVGRRAGRAGATAVGAGCFMLVFLIVALPAAEFQNACDIGEPVLLEPSC